MFLLIIKIIAVILGVLISTFSIAVVAAAFTSLKGGAKFLVLLTALGWIILGMGIAGL